MTNIICNINSKIRFNVRKRKKHTNISCMNVSQIVLTRDLCVNNVFKIKKKILILLPLTNPTRICNINFFSLILKQLIALSKFYLERRC